MMQYKGETKPIRKGEGLFWVHQDIDVLHSHIVALARDMECIALSYEDVEATPAAWLNIASFQKNEFLDWALLLPYLETGWMFISWKRIGIFNARLLGFGPTHEDEDDTSTESE